MDARSTRWKAVRQTQFPWEREALDFVRARLRERGPYRVRANPELLAEDGAANGGGLLVLPPGASRRIRRDAPDIGREATTTNPRLDAGGGCRVMLALVASRPDAGNRERSRDPERSEPFRVAARPAVPSRPNEELGRLDLGE